MNANQDQIKKAQLVADVAHRAVNQHYQTNKKEPYIVHLNDVLKYTRQTLSCIISDLSDKDKYYLKNLDIVSYLHDVLEDTSITEEYLEILFGKEVIDDLTILMSPGNSKMISDPNLMCKYMNTFTRSRSIVPILVKLGDIKANLMNCQINKSRKPDYIILKQAQYMILLYLLRDKYNLSHDGFSSLLITITEIVSNCLNLKGFEQSEPLKEIHEKNINKYLKVWETYYA